MTKYLFLDIDGVLNHQEWYERTWEKRKKQEVKYPYCEFDPLCVERVNRILNETGAKLVISSSWRNDPYLSDTFKEVGLPTEFDKTMNYYQASVMGLETRGQEINYYLTKGTGCMNKNVRYVIIDDDNDFTAEQQLTTLFRTAASPCDEPYEKNGGTGLTEKLTNEIIGYLNRE